MMMMVAPPTPPLDDPARLAALRESGLLDTPPEEAFDRLTRLASSLLHARGALLTLVDAHRQFFKSARGLAEPWASRRETPLSHSICRHVVAAGAPLVIDDADASPLVGGTPAVDEVGIGAYAGVPLHGGGGLVLGDLCVFEAHARAWGEDDLALLRELAAVAEREIEQRVALQRARHAADSARGELGELLAATPSFRALVENSLVGIAILHETGFSYVNPRLAEIFGYSRDELLALSPADLAVDEDRARVSSRVRRRLEGKVDELRYTFRGKRKDGTRIHVEARGARAEVGGRPVVIGTLMDVTDRQRAQAMLRQREEHFRGLIESAWDVTQTVDAEGVVRYASPAVERMLGLAPDDVVGRRAASFVHADDVRAAERLVAAAFATPGETRFGELRLVHRDGSARTVEAAARVPGARAAVAVVHTHDVTEHRRAEHALRQTEERYRMVVRATRSAVWDWDVPGGRISWDGGSRDLLRFSEGEMGSTFGWWYGRLHPEERQPVISALDAALQGVDDTWTQEHRFRRGDGSYATVLDCCSLLRGRDGGVARVIGSMTDVSERTRQEETQRFLARAGAVLNESLDSEATLARLAGLAVPALADCCLVDLARDGGGLRRVARAHADPARERALRETEGGEPDPVVLGVIRSGQHVLVPHAEAAAGAGDGPAAAPDGLALRSWMVLPLSAHGRVLGAITLGSAGSGRRFGPADLLAAESLARRAALAIEHARLYADAQDAIRAREEILGLISHDLRNPLNAIQLTANLLLDRAEDRRADNVRALEIIRRAAGQMNAMVQDLLDVSSLDAGRLALDRARHPPAALLAESRQVLEPIAAQKSVALECRAEEGLPPLSVDAPRLLRVIANLVGNAIKFTPEGGTVTLSAAADAGGVRFTVADTGPGIPPEQLPHVFERYWQARPGDRRGSGLGLDIARGIVEAHGGRITAESEPGGGAVFRFTLPAAEDET